MKSSAYCALMAVLWFIASSVQREVDGTAVACMALSIWYAVSSAVQVFWLERRRVKP